MYDVISPIHLSTCTSPTSPHLTHTPPSIIYLCTYLPIVPHPHLHTSVLPVRLSHITGTVPALCLYYTLFVFCLSPFLVRLLPFAFCLSSFIFCLSSLVFGLWSELTVPRHTCIFGGSRRLPG
ncbi:hypothetical protein BKA81DRAFT_350007 [Phyllosticta paracitricarpa]